LKKIFGFNVPAGAYLKINVRKRFNRLTTSDISSFNSTLVSPVFPKTDHLSLYFSLFVHFVL